MIKISLTEEEKTALSCLRRDQKSNLGERAYYVLLSDTGKSVSDIAKHLSCNGHTIRLWLTRYKERINEIIGEISKHCRTDIETMFVDESHFSNQPYVNRGWFKCGEKK